MDKARLNEVMKTIAEFTRIAEEANKVVEENKELLKAYMTENALTELLGDEHKATYKEIESKRFDSSLFKKEHADMYEAYKKASKSMRFTFS